MREYIAKQVAAPGSNWKKKWAVFHIPTGTYQFASKQGRVRAESMASRLSDEAIAKNASRPTHRIHLEDRGQDFLRWDIDQYGVVVECQPFQAWVWNGTKVTNFESLGPGDILQIIDREGRETTLNYPCVSIEPL